MAGYLRSHCRRRKGLCSRHLKDLLYCKVRVVTSFAFSCPSSERLRARCLTILHKALINEWHLLQFKKVWRYGFEQQARADARVKGAAQQLLSNKREQMPE